MAQSGAGFGFAKVGRWTGSPLLATAIACLALQAVAQGMPPVPAPMPVDDAPTPWACTLPRLLRGEKCLLEGSPAPVLPRDEQRRANIAAAGKSAVQLCSSATTPAGEKAPEPSLRSACEQEIAQESIATCGLDGLAALVDGQERLSPAAALCADHLGAILAAAHAQTAVALGCCRCLAAARCGPALPVCARELAAHAPGAPLRACLERSCNEPCAFLRPPGPASPEWAPQESPDQQEPQRRPRPTASPDRPDKI